MFTLSLINYRRIEKGATIIGSIICDVDTISSVKKNENPSSESINPIKEIEIDTNNNFVDEQNNDNQNNVNGKKEVSMLNDISNNKHDEPRKWASKDIGNFIDESRNIVIPISSSSSSGVTAVPMKMMNKNGSLGIQNNFDKSETQENLSEMFDDFGNPLLPQFKQNNNNGMKPTKINFSESKYHDEFGNPLIRGADENEIAGYRQIREMSAVTRQILDNHIKEKKKQAIEKSARVSSKARLTNRHQNTQRQADDDDSDGNDIPSFLTR